MSPIPRTPLKCHRFIYNDNVYTFVVVGKRGAYHVEGYRGHYLMWRETYATWIGAIACFNVAKGKA